MTASQPPAGASGGGPGPGSARSSGHASVPLQHPGGPAGQPQGPPAPGDPDPSAAPARTRGRLAGVIAAVALVLALLAAATAGWAVHRANVAAAATDRLAAEVARAPAPVPGPTTAGPAETEEPPVGPTQDTTTPDAGPTTEPTLDPQAVYDVKYENRVLTAQTPYSGARYVDLDSPRVDDQTSAEILLYSARASGAVDIGFVDGVTVAAAEEPSVTPNECAEKIQFSPLNSGDRVSFRRGDVFCLKTSLAAAEERADTQKMIVVEIKAVNANNIVSLSATAWDVPR